MVSPHFRERSMQCASARSPLETHRTAATGDAAINHRFAVNTRVSLTNSPVYRGDVPYLRPPRSRGLMPPDEPAPGGGVYLIFKPAPVRV
ncbi:hypothetical protein KCP77_08010 [Salmonella enterica subsp. enterica]|nr:hypothetical protein KCP77_08010 [Salmonella enterica subsp. enterica]